MMAMAQYSITHTCEHGETVQIYGTNTHGERDRRINWLESKPCHDCLNNEALMDANPLTGSEKQVAWANNLRAEAIQKVNSIIEDALHGSTGATRTQEWKESSRRSGEAIIREIKHENSARTIIDNRDNLIQYYNAKAKSNHV